MHLNDISTLLDNDLTSCISPMSGGISQWDALIGTTSPDVQQFTVTIKGTGLKCRHSLFIMMENGGPTCAIAYNECKFLGSNALASECEYYCVCAQSPCMKMFVTLLKAPWNGNVNICEIEFQNVI